MYADRPSLAAKVLAVCDCAFVATLIWMALSLRAQVNEIRTVNERLAGAVVRNDAAIRANAEQRKIVLDRLDAIARKVGVR